MASVKKFNINNISLDVVDAAARDKIDELKKEKQDIFTVSSPLVLLNNNLSIDLSSKASVGALTNLRTILNLSINDNTTKINNLEEKTAKIFQAIFGNKVADDLSFDITISNLENYSNTISDIKTTINENKKNADLSISTLTKNLEDTSTNLNSQISNLNKEYSEFSKSISNRLDWSEKELFGYLYSADTANESNSISRLDKIENLLKIVVGLLLKENIIQIYHKTVSDYNENSEAAGTIKINSTNFPYEI